MNDSTAAMGSWTWRAATGVITWDAPARQLWERLGVDAPTSAAGLVGCTDVTDRAALLAAFAAASGTGAAITITCAIAGTRLDLAATPVASDVAADTFIGIVRDLTAADQADGTAAATSRTHPPVAHTAQRRVTAADPAPADALPDAVAAAVQALRSPLAVLTDTASELIEGRDRMTSSSVDERLASVLRNVRTVARVLTALEDASRTGSDGLGLIPQPVRLSHLVRAALPDLRRLVGDRTVELIVDDDVLVVADPVRVRQVIENLISNAARFSAPSTPIEVVVSSDGDTGEIAVVDHGTGISDTRVTELFRRFAGLDRPEAGIGLGLYVSQQIARAHGGDLTLADTGEEGSTFVLTLPVVQPVRRPKVTGA